MGSGIGKKGGEKKPFEIYNCIIYAINTYHFPHIVMVKLKEISLQSGYPVVFL